MAANTVPSASDALAPMPAALPSLYEYLQKVPDPRRAQGKRHSLTAILMLMVVATLAGRRHRLGVFEWGRTADRTLQQALGFPAGTPAASTLHEVLERVDWEAFAAQLRAWALAVLAAVDPEGQAALSCDGKTVRASLREGSSVAHLLSVFSPEWGITVDLEPVPRKTNELPGASPVLLRLPVAGRTVVLDALFTHEPLAVALVAAGADYVLPVKRNQPGLHAELATIFSQPLPADWCAQQVETANKGHGRQEWRRLTLVAPPLGERLDWGRSQQYFMLERYRWQNGQPLEKQPGRTLVYGITSLSRRQAGAAAVLNLVRSHWQIENGSHWVRDTLFREDESRSSKPILVQVLTGFRCAAVTLLHSERRRQKKSLASIQRRLEQKPWEILQLTGVIS